MDKKYNLKSPGVKRLMREALELKDPTPMYCAQPLEDNLFEWHFTILASQGTDFEGGHYHGRILLPTEYPMKPPSIIMMTPNGRFEIHHKICLSASSYHPELWQPSWSIRTVLLALIGFMPTEGVGAIGSLDSPPEERRRLARCSLEWVCPVCGIPNRDILPPMQEGERGKEKQDKDLAEAADIVTQMAFKSEKEIKAQKEIAKAKDSEPSEPNSLREASTNNVGPRQRLHHHNPQGTTGTNQSETSSNSTFSTPAANVSMVPPTVKRASIQTSPADIPRQSRGAMRFGSLVLIWILIIAIGVLLVRRVYVMANN